MSQHRVLLYALSTCGWCKRTKRFLADHHVPVEIIDVDLLEGEAKERVREAIDKVNPRRSYPTIVIDDAQVVVGFDEEKLKAVLEL